MANARAQALFDLTGRVALVTGGNGGIGRAIALALAEAGAAVAILGRNEAKNEAALADLEAIGNRCVALRVDLTDRASLAPAFARVEAELGPVGILVNNAGIAMISGGVLFEEPDDWDKVLATHLDATFLLSKLAAESMRARKTGKIINMASVYAQFGANLAPSYSAAKGAVIQLTKSMAIELAPYNVQVNAIAPGWIETDMTVSVRSTPWNDEILARVPARRWGRPEEIAGTAVYLAAHASDFVTGATVFVDGGYAVR